MLTFPNLKGYYEEGTTMKRTLAIIAASMLASASIAMPALAQGKSDSAPGHSNEAGMSPSTQAPGQVKEGGNASEIAPGKSMKEGEVDTGTTAAIDDANFGTVISSIRAGKSDLAGLADGPEVNIVEVGDLIEGENRVALDNAVEDNMDSIEALRGDLAELDLDGLSDDEIDAAVAAEVEADGSLTVYTN